MLSQLVKPLDSMAVLRLSAPLGESLYYSGIGVPDELCSIDHVLEKHGSVSNKYTKAIIPPS